MDKRSQKKKKNLMKNIMWETDNIKSRKKFSKKGDDITSTKQKHVI